MKNDPVYFIQTETTQFIKIGRAADPCKRFLALQTAHHEKLILLGVVDTFAERQLHVMFKEDHVRGEWFRPSEKLLTFIKETARFVALPAPLTAAEMNEVRRSGWRKHARRRALQRQQEEQAKKQREEKVLRRQVLEDFGAILRLPPLPPLPPKPPPKPEPLPEEIPPTTRQILAERIAARRAQRL